MTFICTGFSDVNRVLPLKSKVINFWHGTNKKVYLDSQHDLSRFKLLNWQFLFLQC